MISGIVALNRRIAILEPVIDQKEHIVRIPSQGE